MIIKVSGRHLDITPAIKQYAEAKASKLPKYYDLINEIEVICDGSESKSTRVEFVVHAEHTNDFVASVQGPDLYACIDQVTHKLERQLTDHKERHRNRKHTA